MMPVKGIDKSDMMHGVHGYHDAVEVQQLLCV